MSVMATRIRSFYVGSPLARRATEGTLWGLLGKGSIQTASLLRLALLARFLSPRDFGVMAVILLLLNVIDTFTTPGFTQALIQRNEDPSAFYSSVFWANVARASLLVPVTFFLSPMIASFSHIPNASSEISCVSLAILLRTLQNPAIAGIHRGLKFRRLFYMDLAGSVIGLLIACVALLYLRDAWVLILSSLGTELVLLVASYAVNPWRPLLKFDFADIRQLSGFGKWVVGSNIVVFSPSSWTI